MVLARPALKVLEAARDHGPITRQDAARYNGSGVTTADDYLRALAKLGLLSAKREPRPIAYSLSAAGLAVVDRRSLASLSFRRRKRSAPVPPRSSDP